MSQSGNILVGSPGIGGQTNTIMIGSTPAAHAGTDQTACYIGGIYESTVGSTYSPVYIDSNHQLGTLSSNIPTSTFNTFPFLVYQVGQTVPVLGTGTPYYMGSLIPMTKAFDIGNNFTVNGGTSGQGQSNGGYYTAPSTGIYQFMMNIYTLTQPAEPLRAYLWFRSQIQTATNIYEYDEELPGGIGEFPRVNNNFWFTFQATIPLTIGDKVWFNTNTTYVGPITIPIVSVGESGSTPAYSTRISGFKVA